jgi:hypothetical protein
VSKNWAFMETFRIPNFDTDEDYLMRIRIIQTPWFGVYLHKIGTPDSRPTLHDHPWNFVSVVLWGGYDEMVPWIKHADQQLIRPHVVRWINRKRAEDFHFISRLHRTPTWTLMFTGRRRRVWGYRDGDGVWTQFDQHPHAVEFDAALERRRG